MRVSNQKHFFLPSFLRFPLSSTDLFTSLAHSLTRSLAHSLTRSRIYTLLTIIFIFPEIIPIPFPLLWMEDILPTEEPVSNVSLLYGSSGPIVHSNDFVHISYNLDGFVKIEKGRKGKFIKRTGQDGRGKMG